MKTPGWVWKTVGVLAAAWGLGTAPAAAQNGGWRPDHPVRIVVPFPPGGTADFMARALAARLSGELGQQFIVDNKPGAAAALAATTVAHASPDGYTLLFANSAALVNNRYMFKNLGYDPDAFTPVALLGTAPLVLLANVDTPFKTVPDLMKYAHAHQDSMSFASFGTGTLSHLTMELLDSREGVKLEHIPYKGEAEAMTALMGGQIKVFVSTLTSSQASIRAGKVRALGVTSQARTALLPGVPSIAEQGYAGFDLVTWFGIDAPPGTPAPVVDALSRAVAKLNALPDYRQELARIGVEAPAGDSSPAALVAKMKSDMPVMQQLIKGAGIQPQ
ncbi:MAG TPA: tripartite tricarboxylate transporter substrate binding protein [Bordetella sp.]